MQTISELAMKYMADFSVSPVPTATFILEDITKDEPMVYKGYYEANRTWDELLTLGFVEDARPTRGAWLDTLEEKTGRKFRMFMLSKEGQLFNAPSASLWVN